MFKKIRPLLPYIVPILLIIAVILTYRNALRALVLVPITFVIYVFRLITGSIQQEVLWVTFVIITSVIAFFSLSPRRDRSLEELVEGNKYPTRLHRWMETVRRKKRSEYFKWNLAQDLGNLFLEAIAYRQGLTHSQVLHRLRAGQLNLPPEVQAYLEAAQNPYSGNGVNGSANGNWIAQIWQNLTKPRTTSRPKKGQSPLDLEPEIIIRHLEAYLEIDPEIWEA